MECNIMYHMILGALVRYAVMDNTGITYSSITPQGYDYAARMYHDKSLNFNDAPQRGTNWDERYWGDNKERHMQQLQQIADKGGK